VRNGLENGVEKISRKEAADIDQEQGNAPPFLRQKGAELGLAAFIFSIVGIHMISSQIYMN
jgi:hypothetical protein